MPTPADADTSLREDIEAAVASLNETEPEAGAETTTEAAPETVQDTQVEAGAQDTETTEVASEGRARNPDGTFKEKDPATEGKQPASSQAAKPTAAGQGATTGAAPSGVAPVAAPASRAPQSWKPAAREEWAKLPPTAQAEILRVDGEVRRTMQEAAQVRQQLDGYTRAVQPFEAMIRQRGAEPAQAIAGLLQTAAHLWHAPPPQKAQLLAGMIRDYLGTDKASLEMLGGYIDVQPAQQPGAQQYNPQAIAAQVRQDIAREMQQTREAQATEQGTRDIEAFSADPAHEFYEDVRDDMAGLLLAAAQTGKVLSLKDAYAKACKLNDDVSATLSQRAAAKKAQESAAAAAKARKAGVSVRGSVSRSPSGEPEGSLRDDIMKSVAELEAR